MRNTLPLLACLLAGCATQPRASDEHAGRHGAHHGAGHGGAHDFSDAEAWAREFEDPSRDEWQKPDAVLDGLALSPTDVVADVGSGTGYFAVRVARRVPQGHVYGVDAEPAMVNYLEARARKEGLGNLTSVASSGPVALPRPVNVVLVVNTYHHLSERPAYFKQVRAGMACNGRVAIVDFKKGHDVVFRPGEAPRGPPEAMRIAVSQVSAEMAEAGFVLDRHDADLLPHQDVLVYRRADACP